MNDTVLKNLIPFLANAKSPYHAVAQQCKRLQAAGCHRLSEAQTWTLQAGEGYYLTRNDSALIAFRVPKAAPRRFMMTEPQRFACPEAQGRAGAARLERHEAAECGGLRRRAACAVV